MECDDAPLLQEWVLANNRDLGMTFEIVPVIPSKETREVVAPYLDRDENAATGPQPSPPFSPGRDEVASPESISPLSPRPNGFRVGAVVRPGMTAEAGARACSASRKRKHS